MLKVERYTGIEEALDASMVKDVDHVLIRHSYRRGRRILPHTHPGAEEYVIASSGRFRASSEGDEGEFSPGGGEVVVIHYPAGREHALEVLSERLDYFVLRRPA